MGGYRKFIHEQINMPEAGGRSAQELSPSLSFQLAAFSGLLSSQALGEGPGVAQAGLGTPASLDTAVRTPTVGMASGR